MRKVMCGVLAFMLAGSLCINVGAVDTIRMDMLESEVIHNVSVRASGSFSMSVAAYGKSEADKTFPLEAGETVSISAVYSPDDASMDFGLVDPDGVFHYFNVKNGSVDKTIKVEESGNYTFAVRNNSGSTVKVSGFVKY